MWGVLDIFSISSTLVSHPGPIFSQRDAYPIFLLTLTLAFSAPHTELFLSLGTGGGTKAGINKKVPEGHSVSCPLLNCPSALGNSPNQILHLSSCLSGLLCPFQPKPCISRGLPNQEPVLLPVTPGCFHMWRSLPWFLYISLSDPHHIREQASE